MKESGDSPYSQLQFGAIKTKKESVLAKLLTIPSNIHPPTPQTLDGLLRVVLAIPSLMALLGCCLTITTLLIVTGSQRYPFPHLGLATPESVTAEDSEYETEDDDCEYECPSLEYATHPGDYDYISEEEFSLFRQNPQLLLDTIAHAVEKVRNFNHQLRHSEGDKAKTTELLNLRYGHSTRPSSTLRTRKAVPTERQPTDKTHELPPWTCLPLNQGLERTQPAGIEVVAAVPSR
jgi:hypothetical protein